MSAQESQDARRHQNAETDALMKEEGPSSFRTKRLSNGFIQSIAITPLSIKT